jgi:hypothetical protein
MYTASYQFKEDFICQTPVKVFQASAMYTVVHVLFRILKHVTHHATHTLWQQLYCCEVQGCLSQPSGTCPTSCLLVTSHDIVPAIPLSIPLRRHKGNSYRADVADNPSTRRRKDETVPHRKRRRRPKQPTLHDVGDEQAMSDARVMNALEAQMSQFVGVHDTSLFSWKASHG